MKLIQTVTVGSGGAANITFSSIPATFTDLVVVVSANSGSNDDNLFLRFNGSASNYSLRNLLGVGSGNGISQSGSFGVQLTGTKNNTSNTFASGQAYIPNYRAATNKSISSEGVSEANQTDSYQFIVATLWSDTSPITSIEVRTFTGTNLVQHSSASLYGITAGSSGGVVVS